MNVQSKFNPTTYLKAVIGVGTLGSPIALMLASSGGEVQFYDVKPAQLEIPRHRDGKSFLHSNVTRMKQRALANISAILGRPPCSRAYSFIK